MFKNFTGLLVSILMSVAPSVSLGQNQPSPEVQRQLGLIHRAVSGTIKSHLDQSDSLKDKYNYIIQTKEEISALENQIKDLKDEEVGITVGVGFGGTLTVIFGGIVLHGIFQDMGRYLIESLIPAVATVAAANATYTVAKNYPLTKREIETLKESLAAARFKLDRYQESYEALMKIDSQEVGK